MKNFIIVLLVSISISSNKGICSSTSSSIVIIVNKDNPIDNLTASEAKLYWLRKIKKRWPEINKNIKPVDRKSACETQVAFYKKVLTMAGNEVENYFAQKQYENSEKPQDKFASDAQIIDFVSEEQGAIGYVSSSAEGLNKVKIVCTIN